MHMPPHIARPEIHFSDEEDAMIECRPSTITQRPSGDYWDTKRALITCLAMALLGGAVTTTAVAMIAYLVLANSHI
jgi:hypothetical protein